MNGNMSWLAIGGSVSPKWIAESCVATRGDMIRFCNERMMGEDETARLVKSTATARHGERVEIARELAKAVVLKCELAKGWALDDLNWAAALLCLIELHSTSEYRTVPFAHVSVRRPDRADSGAWDSAVKDAAKGMSPEKAFLTPMFDGLGNCIGIGLWGYYERSFLSWLTWEELSDLGLTTMQAVLSVAEKMRMALKGNGNFPDLVFRKGRDSKGDDVEPLDAWDATFLRIGRMVDDVELSREAESDQEFEVSMIGHVELYDEAHG